MKASCRVDVAAPAEADLRAIRSFIARDKPNAATKWLQSAMAAIRSLRQSPYQFERLPEAEELALDDYRHMPHGNYRIIYRVEAKRVKVLRILHAARQLTPEMEREELI